MRKIRQALNDEISEEDLAQIGAHTDEITLGSVEKFQGNERKVIILTTVRGDASNFKQDVKFNIGFLRSPKVCEISK